jgi:hypothetical protein
LHPIVYPNVTPGADLFSDALRSYHDFAHDYVHQVIDHAESYAEGRVHTNGLENLWSLLKRSIKGTSVSVEPFHLFRYFGGVEDPSVSLHLRPVDDFGEHSSERPRKS